MNRTQISLAIFLVFLCLQGLHLLRQRRREPPLPAERPFRPTAYVVNKEIQPPRRFLEEKESVESVSPSDNSLVERQIHPNGSVTVSSSIPPCVAYVTGNSMDWERVTERELRLIPGISTAMARRLIRLRDTEEVSDFRDLRRYPHIGGKTIQKLKAYCVIPHEP